MSKHFNGKTEREEVVQTDSAGGLLARLRGTLALSHTHAHTHHTTHLHTHTQIGKETQDAKDDSQRFYILDPYLYTSGSPAIVRSSTLTTHSQSVSPHPDPSPVPTRTTKKQSGSLKRSSVGAASDSHFEGQFIFIILS